MPAGKVAACGFAAAANDARVSRCGGGDSANSGHSDGEVTPPQPAARGKSAEDKLGQTDGIGSAAGTGPGTAVTIGDEQELATSCRKEEVGQSTDAQRTRCQRAQVPEGRETVRSINASAPVDSQHPTDRATSPAQNEEIKPGLSGRRYVTAGAGDPPYGRVWVGRLTKERPRCNDGDIPNSAVSSIVELTQQPTNKPTKLEEQAANWQAVKWPEAMARVFRTQRAIHEAFTHGNTTKGNRLQERLLG